METERAEHQFLREDPAPLIEHGGEIDWWTFAGGGANLLLARILESELGGECVSRNTSITLKGDAGRSVVAVRDVLKGLAERQGPTTEDAARHAQGASRSRFSKFDRCLPERLLNELLVEGVLDVDGARRAVADASNSRDREESTVDRVR
jgi:ATP-dependent Lhr-like helicase